MNLLQTFGTAALAALTLLPAATAMPRPAAAGGPGAGELKLKIVGSAAYRERIAVSSDAELVVELRESPSLGDDPEAGRVVASRTSRLEGRQVPTAFFLKVEGEHLVPRSSYALRVGLRDAGRPGWVSAPLEVIAGTAEETDVGDVLLVRSESLAFTSTLTCGDVTARFGMRDDRPILQVAEEEFALVEVPSASGAKYEAEGDPTTIFWSKGDSAMISLRGSDLPECRLIATKTRAPSGFDLLPGAEWVVEDIARGGIIDFSRVTLEFREDGSLGGRATCNSYGTRFATNGGRIAVDRRTAATMMACAPELMNQEAKFLAILPELRDWRIDETGALILTAAEGASITARRQE